MEAISGRRHVVLLLVAWVLVSGLAVCGSAETGGTLHFTTAEE